MMRGSKVGDSVWVEPIRGRRLHGAVIAIDGDGLRCVATDEGHSYHTPYELNPSDEPARLKVAEELAPGDKVVLFTGVHRVVESVTRVGRPPRRTPRLRIEFVGAPTTFGWAASEPGTLWRLAAD